MFLIIFAWTIQQIKDADFCLLPGIPLSLYLTPICSTHRHPNPSLPGTQMLWPAALWTPLELPVPRESNIEMFRIIICLLEQVSVVAINWTNMPVWLKCLSCSRLKVHQQWHHIPIPDWNVLPGAATHGALRQKNDSFNYTPTVWIKFDQEQPHSLLQVIEEVRGNHGLGVSHRLYKNRVLNPASQASII